jgi:hypothetical protein
MQECFNKGTKEEEEEGSGTPLRMAKGAWAEAPRKTSPQEFAGGSGIRAVMKINVLVLGWGREEWPW